MNHNPSLWESHGCQYLASYLPGSLCWPGKDVSRQDVLEDLLADPGVWLQELLLHTRPSLQPDHWTSSTCRRHCQGSPGDDSPAPWTRPGCEALCWWRKPGNIWVNFNRINICSGSWPRSMMFTGSFDVILIEQRRTKKSIEDWVINQVDTTRAGNFTMLQWTQHSDINQHQHLGTVSTNWTWWWYNTVWRYRLIIFQL